MIIGISGTNGSGKGAVVDYLKSKGFTHYSARQFLTSELTKRGLPVDRPHLGMMGNEFREKYGAGFLVRKSLELAAVNGITQVVIESIRSTGEVVELHAHDGILLVVDADRKIRYDRIQARASETDRIDFDTFVKEEEREWYGTEGKHDMNIMEVIKMADHTIKNEGTLEDLHRSVEDFLSKY